MGGAPAIASSTLNPFTGAPASTICRILSFVTPRVTKISTWLKPFWSSRARISFTKSGVTPPRSGGVLRFTPRSLSRNARASASASSASSLNVSTMPMRGISCAICRSYDCIARTASPISSGSACGI